MNQIMPGLFLGSLDDSQDRRQLKQHNITHIISIIENAKPYFEEIKYLCIDEEDSSSRLHLFFAESINFIQKARKIEKGNVLVHCFAGISRSATIVIAYMMSCTDTPYETCLGLVKKERKIVKPSPSFVRQLQQYFYLDVKTNRQSLRDIYGEEKWKEDEKIIVSYQKKIENKSIQPNFHLPIKLTKSTNQQKQ